MDTKAGERYPVSFTGSGGEYFKIWIVNILLTILTLYVYSAWAKVRTKRYFHGNTVLDNSSFEYHARPLQILLSRLVAAVLLLIITFGGALHPFLPSIAGIALAIVLPWAIWRSLKFNARMTSYRNVRFGFEGRVGPVILYKLILPYLPVAVVVALLYYWGGFTSDFRSSFHLNELGGKQAWAIGLGILAGFLLIPYIQKNYNTYYVNNYQYGVSKFTSELSVWRYTFVFLVALLITLALPVIYWVFIGAPTNMESLLEWFNDPDKKALNMNPFFMAFCLLYATLFFVAAYIRARLRAHVFANTVLDNRVTLESTVTARGLWWITLSNLLLTILTLGFWLPFAQVRVARYLAHNTAIFSPQPLDEFVGEKRNEVSAFGDEIGDAFDLDMDVGF